MLAYCNAAFWLVQDHRVAVSVECFVGLLIVVIVNKLKASLEG